MRITVVLAAALAFVAMVTAVGTVGIIRTGAALGRESGIQDVEKSVAVGLVLMPGPAIRARAAEPAAPLASVAGQRTAVVQPPDVEMKPLDDSLKFDERRFARPNDAAGALVPSVGGRSSAEAELDALTAATIAENAARGATSHAFTW
jgi:hypothetical protein